MSEYEIAGENGHRVRVLAEDETEALETGLAVDPDIEEGSILDVSGKPVGWDGGDAEDALAEGERADQGEPA